MFPGLRSRSGQHVSQVAEPGRFAPLSRRFARSPGHAVTSLRAKLRDLCAAAGYPGHWLRSHGGGETKRTPVTLAKLRAFVMSGALKGPVEFMSPIMKQCSPSGVKARRATASRLSASLRSLRDPLRGAWTPRLFRRAGLRLRRAHRASPAVRSTPNSHSTNRAALEPGVTVRWSLSVALRSVRLRACVTFRSSRSVALRSVPFGGCVTFRWSRPDALRTVTFP
jgi:hypothetical protein